MILHCTHIGPAVWKMNGSSHLLMRCIVGLNECTWLRPLCFRTPLQTAVPSNSAQFKHMGVILDTAMLIMRFSLLVVMKQTFCPTVYTRDFSMTWSFLFMSHFPYFLQISFKSAFALPHLLLTLKAPQKILVATSCFPAFSQPLFLSSASIWKSSKIEYYFLQYMLRRFRF